MVTSAYMAGRNKYGRPQAMLFANNSGTIVDGAYVPTGDEFTDFIILSDHNRESLDFSINRIEQRERMINGRMRSYHIADKLNVNVSWTMLPSRSFANGPDFDEDGNPSETIVTNREQYTVDGGAGGVELLDWYESNPGSFWVYLAYDKNTNFSTDQYGRLAQYNEIVEVFFADFQYTVTKRGKTNHDFWDVSFSLEEV